MAKGRIGQLAGAVRNARGQLVKRDPGVDGDASASVVAGGNVDVAPEHVDPASALSAGSGTDTGTVRKRRGGWPKGRRRTPASGDKTETQPKLAVGGLQQTIEEVHGFLAALTAIDRIRLQDGQARELAVAIKEVERHYKLPALAADKIALATLAWVAGRIYVPMALDIVQAKKTPRPIAPQSPARPAAPATLDEVAAMPAEVNAWFDPAAVPHLPN